MQTYKLITGSAAEAFHLSRAKLRIYGGGFANGKTTALVALTLLIARDYPGCAILLARETYPKLNTTLRREFIKWCPPSWIKSFDKTKDNTCTLVNGTTVDFRYIATKDTSDGAGSSNLLSANYDFIGVDQFDDPGITQHDFDQLLGRLRGSTPYAGDDPTMPRTGPRWLAGTLNPTLGWPYKTLVKPVHDLRNGIINPDLLCERDSNEQPVLGADGKPQPIIEVFEATTYENAQNLEADYIKTLNNVYKGKMRDRYLLGKWVAFEGVVYDEFDENMHVVPHDYMREHLRSLRDQGYRLTPVEGYDMGIAVPSCYLLGLQDEHGCLHVTEGYYEPGVLAEVQADMIRALREEAESYAGFIDWEEIAADPQIFKRTALGVPALSEQFRRYGINMIRGNNAIMAGITRVKTRLVPQMTLINPYTHSLGCPKLFISDKLRFVSEEFNTYRWKQRGINETSIDEPIDRDDHAMDVLKYMCSRDTPLAKQTAKKWTTKPPARVLRWGERDVTPSDNRSHRYSA